MISLSLRLVISGGREAIIRLTILVVAVGFGVALLLVTMSGINAVNAQNDRYAWFLTGNGGVPAGHQGPTTGHTGPVVPAGGSLWWLLRNDVFGGQVIYRVDVAAASPGSPVPPGIPKLPGPGEYYASPALDRLIHDTASDELGERYPGHRAGLIGDAALPSPNSLVIIVGDAAAQLSRAPGALRASAISATPPNGCNGDSCVLGLGINAKAMDLVLPVVALAMLLPVLIFITTATRLSAARREQRFAAMRLAGATRRQVGVVAAVESTLAAVLGVAAGFGLFMVVRVPIAAIPFTGAPFFPGDLSLSLPDVLIVAIGVPAAAAAAAGLALRRVNLSPLGVTRRVTPKPPRAWRVLPLLAGLADLGFFVVHGDPQSITGQVQAFVPGCALILAGLVLAGPWLTMLGARFMASHTSSTATLIAARRLADDPRAGFRAVSGLVLALFVTTVAIVTLTTQDAKGSIQTGGPAVSNILLAVNQGSFSRAALAELRPPLGPAPSAPLLTRLRKISGVGPVVVLYADPGLTVPGTGRTGPRDARARGRGRRLAGLPHPDQAGLVSCAELAAVPALGRCRAGATAAAINTNIGDSGLAQTIWPAVPVSARYLHSLGALAVFVATDGSAPAVERARTALASAYPYVSGIATFGEASAQANWRDTMYQQLADVVILISLPIAGCTLAASVAAGLADRKRPFSLLRLAGARLITLRRAVALESAVPLLAVSAVAIGTGFGASAMFASVQLRHPMVAPDAAYYLITAAGIMMSLGIIAATFPLLTRITGPEVARNE